MRARDFIKNEDDSQLPDLPSNERPANWEAQTDIDTGHDIQRTQYSNQKGWNVGINADDPRGMRSTDTQRGVNIGYGRGSLNIGDKESYGGSYNIPLDDKSSISVNAGGQKGKLHNVGLNYQRDGFNIGVSQPTNQHGAKPSINVGYSGTFEESENISELFQPRQDINLKWSRPFKDEVSVSGKTPKGNVLDINFWEISDDIVAIDFTINAGIEDDDADPESSPKSGHELTRHGEEFAVFTTVVNAITQYMSKMPKTNVFFQVKRTELQREPLYIKIANRVAKQLGFRHGTPEELEAKNPNLYNKFDNRYNKLLWYTKDQPLQEEFRVDVPNEEWLQQQIDYAIERGRNRNGVPYMGKGTAYVKNIQLPVSILKRLPGMSNEQNNIRKDDLRAIMKIMKDTGKLPLTRGGEEYKPFINVAYNGEAWVNEGNHRIMAAAALGLKSLPVELRYYDGGERIEHGVLYPPKIGLA
jgi:hypothetical protein